MHETRRWTANILGILITATAWLFASSAFSQVAVYEMEFEREDRSINFSFFDGGFFVMDGLTGAGSFVFTFQEVEDNRLKDLYITSENSAETFTAIKKGTRKAVVRATAQTTTGLSHYLAIGELEESLPVQLRGQELLFEVATTLRGYVLASDDESDVDFTDETETLGFAGLASMKMTLDRKRSLDANRLNRNTTEAAAKNGLQLCLLRHGTARRRRPNYWDGTRTAIPVFRMAPAGLLASRAFNQFTKILPTPAIFNTRTAGFCVMECRPPCRQLRIHFLLSIMDKYDNGLTVAHNAQGALRG